MGEKMDSQGSGTFFVMSDLSDSPRWVPDARWLQTMRGPGWGGGWRVLSASHAAAGRGVGPGRGGLGERSFCTAPSPSRPAPTVRFAGRPHALKMRGKCAWGACRPGLLVALWPGRPRPKQSRVRPPLSQSVRVLATHSRAGRRPRRLERSRSCTTRSRRAPPHARCRTCFEGRAQEPTIFLLSSQ